MPDFLTLYIAFFVFLFGICIGSFLNVVILRGLADESIVFPPSKCPKCNTPLKWWHNIPLLSYILLKGKCAFCHEKISIQYFLVELITGILFVATFFKFSYSIQTLVIFAILSMFIVMTVTDLKEKVIFDLHSIILAVLGLILSLLNHNLTDAIIGMLVGVLIMETFAAVGFLFVKSRAFGVGDTFIAAALGAAFGWAPLIFILVLSVVIQALLTLPLYIKKLYNQKNYKTIWVLGVFVVTTSIYQILLKYTPFNMYLIYSAMILVVLFGLYATKLVTSGIKNTADALMLPFGPALFIAATFYLFTT